MCGWIAKETPTTGLLYSNPRRGILEKEVSSAVHTAVQKVTQKQAANEMEKVTPPCRARGDDARSDNQRQTCVCVCVVRKVRRRLSRSARLLAERAAMTLAQTTKDRRVCVCVP